MRWGAPPASAQVPAAVAGLAFDQHLNAQLPLDAAFVNERGATVRLGELFRGRPVILVLAYYRCPQLCNLVLNGLLEALRKRWMPIFLISGFLCASLSLC